MSYVVYHKSSTRMIKTFVSRTGAKRSCTCMNRNAGFEAQYKDNGPYSYTDIETYNNHVVTKVKVKNLMTGKEIEIDSNTPRCCDPSSETYWST